MNAISVNVINKNGFSCKIVITKNGLWFYKNKCAHVKTTYPDIKTPYTGQCKPYHTLKS